MTKLYTPNLQLQALVRDMRKKEQQLDEACSVISVRIAGLSAKGPKGPIMLYVCNSYGVSFVFRTVYDY